VKDIKYILILIFFSGSLLSQIDSAMIKKSSAKNLKRLGKSSLQQNDPASAISFFEAYLLKNKNDAEVKLLLGAAFMQIRDYDRAQHMFLNAYTTNKEKAPEALYYHALMMKSNAQYDSARYNFQKFKKEYKGKDKKLKRFASKEIVYCDSLVRIMGTEYPISIQHLDTSINKVNAEGAPINLSNNVLLFTSLRTEKSEYIIEDDTAKGIKRKLYYATRKENEWKFSGEYGNGLNDPDYNVGNASFSPDRDRIYFTRCKLNYLDKMVCAIYVSEKNGDEWTEPVKLPKVVNDPKYTSTMPTVTSDPAKGNDVIYFVSNNPKGKGGLDIWYTVYNKKTKTYKAPKNAGSKVNTAQDEMSPFFDNATRSLYFSSNGLGGLGGFDVFKTKTDGKKWTGSENIGQPINTGADDIFYTISTAGGEGFFVSNRKGGNALKNATCCDDIYFYKQIKYVRLQLKGNVSEVLDNSEVVPNAIIEMYIKDKKSTEKFLVKKTVTDSLGNYLLDVEAGQDYYLVVKKDDFLGSSVEVSTNGMIESKEIATDLKLFKKPKEPIHIPNILYEFDRSNMVESSKLSLDTTVLKLMEINPELIIEIQAHTDSKGNDQYNLKLSQKRAESVVTYLKRKGIDQSRLRAQGYGETKPIAPNENADGSDNPEGRAKNRRTDFKIIGVVDAEIIKESGVD
jgi:outer membrane protein OmpA-like peptidoglycan-associated protein/tetratricopeptide (TPR) repeat protein